MKYKKILICGAGIAGLTTAYWLKRYGFTPILVEKYPTLRKGGYKIDIRGVALEVIEHMGLTSQIYESRTALKGATLIDTEGKHETKVDANLVGSRVEGDLEIMRGDLCEILFQKCGVECLFGDSIKTISETREGVGVEFHRNPSRLFDLVIGADGLHSTVRSLAFGDETKFLKPLGMYISVFTVPNFLNLDHWEIEYHEPKRFVNIYSMGKETKAGFAFSFSESQKIPEDMEQQKKLLKDAFAGVQWEVPRLLAALETTQDFYFDSISQVHMSHWSKGRVALVGDAAFAPSPLSGQGTSLALVGAYVLAGEIAKANGNSTQAFHEYEHSLQSFVEKNQKLVETSVAFMSDKLTWQVRLHRCMMKIAPSIWIYFLKKGGVRRIHKASCAYRLKKYRELLN